MTPETQKELFSKAYVRAVACVAGLQTTQPELDDDSVDLMITGIGPKGTKKRPRLELQLKCSSQSELMKSDGIHFPLSVKNYDDLRVDTGIKRLLVVVLVPEKLDDWLDQDESQMVLKKCGYWLSLLGEDATTNETSKTVTIPKANIFTPKALKQQLGL